MDFFFSVQELLDIEGVLGVIIGGVLVVRVLGQVVLVAQKRAHTPQLQDAFAAIQHRQFVPAHKFFATMSSDELKKLSKKSTFDSSVSNIYSHFLPCVLRANEI